MDSAHARPRRASSFPRLLVLVAFLVLAVPPLVPADHAGLASLPEPRAAAQAALVGSDVLIMGGFDPVFGQESQAVTNVVAWSPRHAPEVIADPNLPITMGGVLWADERAFLVHWSNGTVGDLPLRITAYDPATNTMTPRAATFPMDAPIGGWASVWTGRHFYLLGGGDGESYTNTIVRYDPAADEVEVLPVRLPAEVVFASAVWDGRLVHLLGGAGCAPRYPPWCDRVVTFEPATGNVVLTDTRLPLDVALAAHVETPYGLLILGGIVPWFATTDAVIHYEPATREVRVLDARLPHPSALAASVWTGDRALLFGGWDGGAMNETSAATRVFSPVPGVPRDVRALPDPLSGGTRVTWYDPDPDGMLGDVIEHRVYRDDGDGLELAGRVPAGVHTFTDRACVLPAECEHHVTAVNFAGEGPAATAWPGSLLPAS